ncbi:MAG: hypothetical protein IH939_14170 [Acidobacteria bacterium]|nr:hypothetical protein [Acidobacteriota bacterium]
MTHARRFRHRLHPQHEPDLDSALDAMTADELRAFVRDALERLDDEPRGELVDSLIARAAKGSSGWRPPSPSRRIVDEVKSFADAALRVGYAEPHEVDEYLRQGTKAFLAGEHETARGVFEALLPPIADVEVDLGQHELVDEVLTVNVHECAVQYAVTVYVTTPLEDRAEALCTAIDAVAGIASFWEPLGQMERVATGPLPQLDAFLPCWVTQIERESSSEGEWDSDRDRWLREAILRLEGVTGLERIARHTKKPEALRAWCAALVDRGEWAAALQAYGAAAALVGTSYWRGDFLDGAALAAQQLGRRDTAKRFETAWLGAPSLVRLLRWLGAGAPTATTLVRRAKKATTRCPAKAGRQLGLLLILTDDARAAAKLLAKAPGLGWSDDGHPGHVLFPAFAGLLAEEIGATLSTELYAGLQDAPRDLLDMDIDMDRDSGDGTTPKLTTPSIAELIASVRPGASIESQVRVAMLEAMRASATRRVQGILGNKRRRHYGHAATLVACCLELAPVVGKQKLVSDWVADLQQEYSRFSAFRGELERALASISL